MVCLQMYLHFSLADIALMIIRFLEIFKDQPASNIFSIYNQIPKLISYTQTQINSPDDISKLLNESVKAILECIGQTSKILEPRTEGNKNRENLNHSENKESNVRVIYTGGTIGMVRNKDNVLGPIPNEMEKRIRANPSLHDDMYAISKFGEQKSKQYLVLPYVEGENRRVIYQITEYTPLLDSSNMSMSDWIRIAKDIHQSYDSYDGFVIMHGTDTLTFTASALSFMLENLGKTVIITGAQIPIFETRTDGRDNLSTSLILAGNYVIPEVCVFFAGKLMRGNRSAKISCDDLDAFDSLNMPPLARCGLNVDIDNDLIFRMNTVEHFNVHTDIEENVGILRIYPNISIAAIAAFLAPPIRGLVLQTFGSGNVPSNRAELLQELKAACNRGTIIVNCTQCIKGTVAELYETGKVLGDIGVIPGFDMTAEAAMTKLSYVLSKKDWSEKYKKKMMQTNLRGELSTTSGVKAEKNRFIDAVAQQLQLSTPRELRSLERILFPTLISAAVIEGDIRKIDNFRTCGADLAGVNQDNRTALHLACHESNTKLVDYLLRNGVSVHVRDRYDKTPLLEAIEADNHDIIKLLMKCGANLTEIRTEIGEKLCAAAARGALNRLKSFQLAGADLSQGDTSHRTALHMAALHGHKEIVEYLLSLNVKRNEKDLMGLTALEYAKRSDRSEIVSLLSNK